MKTKGNKSKAPREPASGPSTKQQWTCDFCTVTPFDTYEAALEHENTCKEKDNVNIAYQPKKKLGLVPINGSGRKDGAPIKFVSLSKNSPVFRFAKDIRAAANELFALDDGAFADSLDAMVDFGRKNLPKINVNVKGGGADFDLDGINNEVMKAALKGHLRPGDCVKTVEYKVGSKIIDTQSLNVDNNPEGAQDLVYILKCERYYPVKLMLHRRPAKPTNVPPSLQNNPLKELKTIDLSRNPLVRESSNWHGLSKGLCQLHTLEELRLDRNDIGLNCCLALATLLKKKGMSLKRLSLQQNSINDRCISILVEALKANVTLERLDLSKNDGITAAGGWNQVMKLLCDKTSIESTYRSNHSLKDLGSKLFENAPEPNSYSSPTAEEPGGVPVNLPSASSASSQLRSVSTNITEYLELNKSRASRDLVARQKIWQFHFHSNVDSFDLTPLLDTNVKLMPHLLAWFTNNDNPSEELRHRKVYHLVRNWNIDALLGYPSAESLRIGSRITELETKTADLEALIKKLKAENEAVMGENMRLREDNSELVGKNKASPTSVGDVPSGRPKRRRRS